MLLPARGRLTQQRAVNGPGLDLAVVLGQAEVLAYNDSVLSCSWAQCSAQAIGLRRKTTLLKFW